MMRPIPALLLTAFLACPVLGAGGLELTLSKAHRSYVAEARWIGTLSYFRPSLFPWPGISEWGIAAMPPFGDTEVPVHLVNKADNFVGAFTGHVFPLWRGLVRPGYQLGSTWEEVRGSTGQTDGRFALYYAFRIQASCLTFILSNRGQGFGVNFSL